MTRGEEGGAVVQGGDLARGEEGEQECKEVIWPEGRRGSRSAGRWCGQRGGGGAGVLGGGVARGEEGEQECKEVMWPEGRRGSRSAGR